MREIKFDPIEHCYDCPMNINRSDGCWEDNEENFHYKGGDFCYHWDGCFFIEFEGDQPFPVKCPLKEV